MRTVYLWDIILHHTASLGNRLMAFYRTVYLWDIILHHTASLGNWLMAFYRTVYLWDIILHHWAIDLWHFTGLCTSGISYCIIGQSTYGILQDSVPLGYHTASLGNWLMAFYRTMYLWDIILHHWVIDLWHFTGLCTSGISYCIMLHHWAIDLWHFTRFNYPVMQHCVTEDQTSQTHYCGNLHFKLDWKIPLAYISGFLYYIYHKVMFLHLPCVGANLFVTTYSIHKTYQLT